MARTVTLPVHPDFVKAPEYKACAICGKRFRNGEISTVRQLWLDRGGYGTPPPASIIHDTCEKQDLSR